MLQMKTNGKYQCIFICLKIQSTSDYPFFENLLHYITIWNKGSSFYLDFSVSPQIWMLHGCYYLEMAVTSKKKKKKIILSCINYTRIHFKAMNIYEKVHSALLEYFPLHSSANCTLQLYFSLSLQTELQVKIVF